MPENNVLDLSSNYKLTGCYIEIISNCNLRCLHCYNESGTSNEVMSMRAFKNAVDSIPSNDKDADITISGGEPLLHPEVWKFIDVIDKKNIGESLIITNATLIDKEKAKKLAASNIGIQVSLNGSCEEIHDQLCGKGSFQKTLKGLECLVDEGLQNKIHVRYTLADFNKNDVPDFLKLLISYGIKTMSIADLSNSGRAAANLDALCYSVQEKENVKNRIAQQVKNFEKDIDINFKNDNYTGGCPLIYESEEPVPLSPRIDAFGNVYLCQAFLDEIYSFGNVYLDSLSKIVSSSKFSEFIWYCRFATRFIPECRKCVWKEMCGQGCIANVLSSTERLSPDGDCYFRRKDYLVKFFEKNDLTMSQ